MDVTTVDPALSSYVQQRGNIAMRALQGRRDAAPKYVGSGDCRGQNSAVMSLQPWRGALGPLGRPSRQVER
jgi:hypothetical protein